MSVRNYQRIQPVETELMALQIRVLKILFDGNKSRNQIFNALRKSEPKISYQSDKSTVLCAIKYLEKFELVKESVGNRLPIKSRRRYTRKQIHNLELTQIGTELSQLIYYLDEYSLTYNKLKEKINHHFADGMINLKPTLLRSRLRRKEWQYQEINEYDKLIEGVLFLETHLPLVLFNVLLSKYLKIIYSYSLNDLAKEILKKVIIDSITQYILNRLEGILADKINSNNPIRDNAFRTTYVLLSGWMRSHIGNHVDMFSKNRLIQEESLNLTTNLYNILNPEKNYLQNMLKRKAKADSEVAAFIQALESNIQSRGNGFKS
jgi:hypothetical protein